MGKMIGLHRPLRKSRFHLRAATGACRSFPFWALIASVGSVAISKYRKWFVSRRITAAGGPRPSASIWSLI
jgi:hypothetical protein